MDDKVSALPTSCIIFSVNYSEKGGFLRMKIINSTPRKDGFRMPGEFEPHADYWML
jgi:hypothetical protein